MKKLHAFVQAEDQGSSWYRAIPPLHRLLWESEYLLELIMSEGEYSWPKLVQMEHVFFMSPHDPTHAHFLAKLKELGKFVWIDYDDNPFAVPFDHVEWKKYRRDEIRSSIKECLRMADCITVSTEALRDALLSEINCHGRIVVVPNAIDDTLYPEPTAPNPEAFRTIVWRGGATHARDLQSVGPALAVLMKKGFQVVFMGTHPHCIEEHLVTGQYSHIPGVDPALFYQNLKQLNAAFHVIPLVDSAFNRSKSNIAYLEGTWIGGSLCIVPEFWRDTGAVRYHNADELIEKILQFHDDPIGRATLVREAQESIRSRYLLSRVNNLRGNILAPCGEWIGND